MIDERPLSADRVPTLTEVVELDLPAEPQLPDESPLADPPPVQDGPAAPQDAVATAEPAPAATAAPAQQDTVPADPGPEQERPAAAAATAAAVPDAANQDLRAALNDGAAPAAAAPAQVVVDTEALVGQVLAELLPRIEMLLESRLREAVAPALACAADTLIRDSRERVSETLRELVREAVDRALQRRHDA